MGDCPVQPLQGHLKQVALVHVQTWSMVPGLCPAAEYPQGGRCHDLSQQPAPGLGHPSQWKGVSLCSEGTSCVSRCAHCLRVCHRQPLKRARLSLFHTLPLGVYTHWWELPWGFFSPAEQSHLSQPCLRWEMFQSLNQLCGPLLDALQYVDTSLVLENPELDTRLQVGPHQCWAEGKSRLPQPAGNAFLDAAQILSASFATRAHCCLIFNLSTRPSMSFSGKLFSRWFASACSGAWGYTSPGAGLWISLRWSSFLPISPAFWDPHGWQHNPLVCLFSRFFYCLWTCWV